MEDIPASAGWPQVFGSVALFLLLTQALTGILLAINYAASPDESYRSVTYIMREVTAGRMIRGLHHWGASFMIVGVVLHMAQVFLYGAYKKPGGDVDRGRVSSAAHAFFWPYGISSALG